MKHLSQPSQPVVRPCNTRTLTRDSSPHDPDWVAEGWENCEGGFPMSLAMVLKKHL